MKGETVKFGDFGLDIDLSLRHLNILLLEWFKVRESGAGGDGRGGVEKSAVTLSTMNSKIYTEWPKKMYTLFSNQYHV